MKDVKYHQWNIEVCYGWQLIVMKGKHENHWFWRKGEFEEN